MSYGLKYTVPFKTISEVSCVINIEVKDFVGTTHLPGAKFLVAGGDEDVKLERCTYNLIEV